MLFFFSPAFVINGNEGGCLIKLHLAYHSMEHYSSVRSKEDPGDGPAHLFHRSKLLQKVFVHFVLTILKTEFYWAYFVCVIFFHLQICVALYS